MGLVSFDSRNGIESQVWEVSMGQGPLEGAWGSLPGREESSSTCFSVAPKEMKAEARQMWCNSCEANFDILRDSPPPICHILVMGTLCMGSEPSRTSLSDSFKTCGTPILCSDEKEGSWKDASCLVLILEKSQVCVIICVPRLAFKSMNDNTGWGRGSKRK